MEDTISVIIPMYNTQNFIAKLLDCLKKQSYKNLEIVIINDGSTDDSLKIVQNYQKNDTRIKLISTPNGGVSRARNIGLENATGSYITFLDSDDYIEYDMYENMLKKIKEENVDAIRCNYVKENDKSEVISKGNMQSISNKKLNRDEIKDIVIPYIFENKIEAYTPLLMFKSEILKKIKPFREDIHMMEDLLFYLDILLNVDSIYFYDYHCYHYIFYSSSSSKSRKNLLRNFGDVIKVVAIVEEFLKKNNFGESVYNQVYYIYSTMLVKYVIRTFQKDDEYKLSYEKVVELLDNLDVIRIIEKAKFRDDNVYIKNVGEMIQKKNYKGVCDYAESIKDVVI